MLMALDTRAHFAIRPVSVGRHSALIQACCSSRCSAGYRDPCWIWRASCETCWMRLAMAQPCLGSSEMLLRIKRSRVPWTRSVGFAICLDYLQFVADQRIIAQAGLLTDQPAGIREDDPGSILIVLEKKPRRSRLESPATGNWVDCREPF